MKEKKIGVNLTSVADDAFVTTANKRKQLNQQSANVAHFRLLLYE